MMALSLAAVLWVRHNLKERRLINNLASAVGVAPVSGRVDLCQTRVTRVKTASGVELYENGMKWMMKKNAVERQLDPISVEKWFGANCSVLADSFRPVALKESEAAWTVVTFEFLHGATQAVKQTASGHFIWGARAFRSEQLATAIGELPEIREAGPSGRPQPASP